MFLIVSAAQRLWNIGVLSVPLLFASVSFQLFIVSGCLRTACTRSYLDYLSPSQICPTARAWIDLCGSGQARIWTLIPTFLGALHGTSPGRGSNADAWYSAHIQREACGHKGSADRRRPGLSTPPVSLKLDWGLRSIAYALNIQYMKTITT